MTCAKGQIGARWLAEDDNGDTLQFKVEIRGVNETAWKLVRDKVRERYLSWDSTAYPDGKYVLRVTASDAPSNPPDQALTGRTGKRSVPDRQHAARDYVLHRLGIIAAVSREGRSNDAGQSRVFRQRRRLDRGRADHPPDRFPGTRLSRPARQSSAGRGDSRRSRRGRIREPGSREDCSKVGQPALRGRDLGGGRAYPAGLEFQPFHKTGGDYLGCADHSVPLKPDFGGRPADVVTGELGPVRGAGGHRLWRILKHNKSTHPV